MWLCCRLLWNRYIRGHLQPYSHIRWRSGIICSYCCRDTSRALLTDKGYSGHLFGLTLPIGTDAEQMAARLAKERISVSVRGNFIRVSPHVYNDQQDAEKLSAVLIRYL